MNALKAKVEAQVGKGKMEIIAFPCTQFGKQEPGANSEILPGLKYVRPGNGYVPNFIMTQKTEVNGDDEEEMYTFLKATCPRPTPFVGQTARLFWSPIRSSDIQWNYEKFLIDGSGKPVKRYTPDHDPETLYDDMIKLINAAKVPVSRANRLDV